MVLGVQARISVGMEIKIRYPDGRMVRATICRVGKTYFLAGGLRFDHNGNCITKNREFITTYISKVSM